MSSRIPLSARPLDKLWFCFFLMHIPTTIFMDCQSLYPSNLIPQFLKDFTNWYISFTKDPLIKSLQSNEPEMFWFKSLITLELVFQLPVFIIGSYCLYHNIKKVYPLLLIYASSTSTTLLPVLAHLFRPLPLTSTGKPHIDQLSSTELAVLVAMYGPFLVLPLVMCVDMARRLGGAGSGLGGSGKKVQ